MLLEVNDLSISYGKGNPVVHGVSFSVDKGRILAIIGESGSGKTTVLRAVGHILPRQGQVTGGHILFEGKESETKTIREKTICRALMNHSDLILADEPTSALDVTNQAVVVREMMDVCARADTAIIVVTHNMALASYMADTILVMKDGNAVEYGSAEKVIYHPKDPYTKLLLAAVPDPGGVLS